MLYWLAPCKKLCKTASGNAADFLRTFILLVDIFAAWFFVSEQTTEGRSLLGRTDFAASRPEVHCNKRRKDISSEIFVVCQEAKKGQEGLYTEEYRTMIEKAVTKMIIRPNSNRACSHWRRDGYLDKTSVRMQRPDLSHKQPEAWHCLAIDLSSLITRGPFEDLEGPLGWEDLLVLWQS